MSVGWGQKKSMVQKDRLREVYTVLCCVMALVSVSLSNHATDDWCLKSWADSTYGTPLASLVMYHGLDHLFSLVGCIAFGILAWRWNRKSAMLAALGCCLVGVAISQSALASPLHGLVFVADLGMGGVLGATLCLVIESAPAKARAMCVFVVSWLSILLSLTIKPLWPHAVTGERPVFWWALLCVAATLIAGAFIRESPVEESEPDGELVEKIWHSWVPAVILFLMLAFAWLMVEVAVGRWVAGARAASEDHSPIHTYGLANISHFLGGLVAIILSRYLGRRGVIYGYSVAGFLLFLALPAIPTWRSIVVPTIGLQYFAMGISSVIIVYAVELFPRSSRALGVGVADILYSVIHKERALILYHTPLWASVHKWPVLTALVFVLAIPALILGRETSPELASK